MNSPKDNEDMPDGVFLRWIGLMLGFAMLFDAPLVFGTVSLTLLPLGLFIFHNHLPPLWIFLPYMITIMGVGFFGGLKVGIRGADWAMKRFFATDMTQWDKKSVGTS